MPSATHRFVLVAVVLAGGSAAVYWHFSPHLALQGLASAAEARDAERFNARVDYPALRESLKGQLAARVTGSIDTAGRDNPFEALGSLLGLALVNQAVDAFVRPEVVMTLMAEGTMEPRPTPATAGAGVPPPASPTPPPRWTLERIGANRVIAWRQEAPAADPSAGLVLVRHGFADWKLTDIRLPEPPR
jgi:hypothetical protein